MTQTTPPRVRIVWTVLEAAKDNHDQMVVNACRRLIVAERRGWRQHHDPQDWALVQEFYN